MNEIVMWLIEGAVSITALILLFIGFKYWVDKGSKKFFDRLNENMADENAKLKRELKTYKRLYKESQELVKIKQQEITTLREIALDEQEIEEVEDD